MDIFRVFDSLNDIDQLKFGIGAPWEAAGAGLGPGTVGGAAHPEGLVRRPVFDRWLAAAVPNCTAPYHTVPSLTWLQRACADSVRAAGGVVEGTLCYTGDVSNPRASKYTLEYYMGLAGTVLQVLL